MNFSNRYIFGYSVVMVVVVAALLSLVSLSLKSRQEKNIEIETKKNMLKSIGVFAENSRVEQLYDKHIKRGMVIDIEGNEIEGVEAFDIDLQQELSMAESDMRLPLFMAVTDDNSEVVIVPVRGGGLWGPVWGYIALQDDYNTIYGATFDHSDETPGLGGEISTPAFTDNFKGKKLFEGGEFVSISVVKGGADSSDIHGVDAISGGTLTSKGVETLLYDCLYRYVPFFEKLAN